jgi:actin-like ATPase involved in cell morphogenesis
MGYALGLDLGTTFTAAAVHRNGRAEIVALGNRSSAIPSLVFLREDEEILVGEAAERRGGSDPRRLAREFKRRMGDAAPILLGTTPYSAERITAVLMRDVIDIIAAREGSPPDAIVITYPANWGPYKTDLLREAAKLADVRDAVLLTEPVAAAVQYASTERVDGGAVIAVYDLGGGTFDAAVLRKTDAGFEQLGAPDGIERLGGIDFDEAVFRHVRDALGTSFDDLDHTDPQVRAAVLRLRQDCVIAKEALSADTDASVPAILPGLQSEIRITRGEFEAMIRPTLRETVRALQRAIASAGLSPDDLQAVLLVGGSSRIPLVAEMVSSEIDRPVAVDADPKHAVALGASLVAANHAVATPARSADATVPPSSTNDRPVLTEPAAAQPESTTTTALAPTEPRHGSTRGRVGLLVALGALLLAAGVAIAAVVTSGDDTAATAGGPTSTIPDAAAESTAPAADGQTSTPLPGAAPIPYCTSPSGRCAFLTDLRLEGDQYLGDYVTEGFDPLIFEPGVKGAASDHHVHFYFDTVPEANAGTNGSPPGLWTVWDRDAGGGQLVFDALGPGNQSANGGAGATQLCVGVADSQHGIVVGTGNCLDLPASGGAGGQAAG